MFFKLQIFTILSILFLTRSTNAQCGTGHTLITVYYGLTPIQVCIPSYSVIKHCLIYWTSTSIQKYATPSHFQCSRCAVYTNEQFIINLVTSATSNNYYLSCIPNSLQTINCEYYIEKVFEDRTVTFECGTCPVRYPTIVKGFVNEYSFCVEKSVSNCIRYGQAGLDRIGFTRVKCDSCQAKFVLDFATNRCLSTIQNCVSYDSLRKCTKCNYGFTLRNQQCIRADSWLNQPQQLQQKTSKNSSNEAKVSPCLQFSRRFLEICIKCSEKYIMWNGQCLLCPDDSYINNRGECITGQFPNCGLFSQEGLCLNCKNDFKFNNELTACISIVPSKKCPENTTRINYVLINNACVGIDANCQQNSYGINGCFNCKSGFYAWEGVCYFYR